MRPLFALLLSGVFAIAAGRAAGAGAPVATATPSALLTGASLSDDAAIGTESCVPRHVTLTLIDSSGASHEDPQIAASSGACALVGDEALTKSALFPRAIVARCAVTCGSLPALLLWLVPDDTTLDGLSVAALPADATLAKDGAGQFEALRTDSAGQRWRILRYDPDEELLARTHDRLADPPADPHLFAPAAIAPVPLSTGGSTLSALDPAGALLLSGRASLSTPTGHDLVALFHDPDDKLRLVVLAADGKTARPAPVALEAPCDIATAPLSHAADYPRLVVASCTSGEALWLFPMPGLGAPARPFVFTSRPDDHFELSYSDDGLLQIVETARESGRYPRTATTQWRYADDGGGFARSITTYEEQPPPAAGP